MSTNLFLFDKKFGTICLVNPDIQLINWGLFAAW